MLCPNLVQLKKAMLTHKHRVIVAVLLLSTGSTKSDVSGIATTLATHKPLTSEKSFENAPEIEAKKSSKDGYIGDTYDEIAANSHSSPTGPVESNEQDVSIIHPKFTGDEDITLTISSAHGDFQIRLNQVDDDLFSNVSVFIHDENGQHLSSDSSEGTGCLYTGQEESTGQFAAFVSCDLKSMTGMFRHKRDLYHVAPAARSRRWSSGNTENSHLLTKRSAHETVSKITNRLRRESEFHPDDEWTAPNKTSRRRRSTAHLELTLAVVADEETLKDLTYRGYDTQDKWRNYFTVLYSAVASEFSRQDQLGYAIKLKVKSLTFWITNPASCLHDDGIYIMIDRFQLYIAGATDPRLQADSHILHVAAAGANTGKTICSDGSEKENCSPSDWKIDDRFLGVAMFQSVCSSGSVAVTRDYGEYQHLTATHELAHTLGIGHPWDASCYPKPWFSGLMGTDSWGWNSCDKAALAKTISNPAFSCLLPAADFSALSPEIPVAAVYPGQLLDKDADCITKFGSGYQYIKGSSSKLRLLDERSCSDVFLCASDQSSRLLVRQLRKRPMSGEYCGATNWCRLDQTCLPWSTDLSGAAVTVVGGSWSTWSPMTACSASCGTGVKYRFRTCSGVNSECPGESLEYETCNTQVCDNSDVTAALDSTRVGLKRDLYANTCTELASLDPEGLLTSMFSYDRTDKSGCLVRCYKYKPDRSGGKYEIISTAPDGVVCDPGQGQRGKQNVCVRGQCRTVFCDGRSNSGAQLDACGVCGGDGSTCSKYSRMFSLSAFENSMKRLLDVPVGAFDVIAETTPGFDSKTGNMLTLQTFANRMALEPRRDGSEAHGVEAGGSDWSLFVRQDYQVIYSKNQIQWPVRVAVKQDKFPLTSSISVSFRLNGGCMHQIPEGFVCDGVDATPSTPSSVPDPSAPPPETTTTLGTTMMTMPPIDCTNPVDATDCTGIGPAMCEAHKSALWQLCTKTCGYCEDASVGGSCVDVLADCSDKSHMCDWRHIEDTMKQDCPYSCAICAEAVPGAVVYAPGQPTEPPPSGCYDYEACSPSECSYKKSSCKKTCDRCSADECVDTDPNCPLYVDFCSDSSLGLDVICKQSCGFCPSSTTQSSEAGCTDGDSSCPSFSMYCSDAGIAALCPFTCDQCPQPGGGSCADGDPGCPHYIGYCSDAGIADLCKLSCGKC